LVRLNVVLDGGGVGGVVEARQEIDAPGAPFSTWATFLIQ